MRLCALIKGVSGIVLENSETDRDKGKKMRNMKQRKIAEIMNNLIAEGDSIMLDASEIAQEIVRLLDKKELAVITNSASVAFWTVKKPGWRVLLTGGTLSSKTHAFVGPYTDRTLQRYQVDKAIISCDGIALSTEITDADMYYANSRKMMLAAAKEKILAVESDKFEKTAFAGIGTLCEMTTVVTDRKPDREWKKIFEKNKVQCLYPDMCEKDIPYRAKSAILKGVNSGMPFRV